MEPHVKEPYGEKLISMEPNVMEPNGFDLDPLKKRRKDHDRGSMGEVKARPSASISNGWRATAEEDVLIRKPKRVGQR